MAGKDDEMVVNNVLSWQTTTLVTCAFWSSSGWSDIHGKRQFHISGRDNMRTVRLMRDGGH